MYFHFQPFVPKFPIEMQDLSTSRNFILPCARWMCIPSDFVGMSGSGLMVLPPTLQGRFFQHGLETPFRASINLALFGFKMMNEGMNLPTSNSRLLLFQTQVQSDHLIPEFLSHGSGTNFWNRTYFDHFLKVGEGFGFSALELNTSQVYVVGQETSTQLEQHVLHHSTGISVCYFQLHHGTTSISCQGVMNTFLHRRWSTSCAQGCKLDF